jgi:hypothetical protein
MTIPAHDETFPQQNVLHRSPESTQIWTCHL